MIENIEGRVKKYRTSDNTFFGIHVSYVHLDNNTKFFYFIGNEEKSIDGKYVEATIVNFITRKSSNENKYPLALRVKIVE